MYVVGALLYTLRGSYKLLIPSRSSLSGHKSNEQVEGREAHQNEAFREVREC